MTGPAAQRSAAASGVTRTILTPSFRTPSVHVT
eukprot:CAMPEP_0206260876 /NCGR_PEP_ID=MMETSP0047_2-20121206/27334_1 /ASSEMBLY_ACC=CAM_ASM_000192 /TAXON_ID=195065 /ORGANISM="Chroomonas mesostigmatica_cf, Strain CCMP1168" /LENGTH=32 /DNA_ID= /DNA_START= /DNA_END= /DNA_ORIENTATION=